MTMTLEPPRPEAHPPMTPPRRRYDARARQARPKTHARQAQEYADAIYRALRRWDVYLSTSAMPKISYADFRDDFGSELVTTLGMNGKPTPSMLRLPHGDVLEAEAGQLISSMCLSGASDRKAMGRLLDLLRSGRVRTPETLIRERGWQSDAPRHAGWAVAVLSLAASLGDRTAASYIPYCRRVMERVDLEICAAKP